MYNSKYRWNEFKCLKWEKSILKVFNYPVVRSSLTSCTSVESSVHLPNQTIPRLLRKYKQKPQGVNKT